MQPGVISYSAGSGELDPWKFRRLQGIEDKIGQAVELFPQLQGLIGDRPPIVINTYPAALGSFPSAVYVDTYLRPANFSRALLLSAQCRSAAIVLAQPLVAAEMIALHVSANYALPPNVVFCLGGYVCPSSLEGFIVEHCARRRTRCVIVHAYGVAEVDAACLIGITRTSASEVLYHRISKTVELDTSTESLRLRLAAKEMNAPWFETGDVVV